MSSALKQAVPKLKNASRLLTTLMGTSQRKKVDPKSLTPMIYPYTLTAKAIQFPWVYFYKNAWWWRYYLYAWIVTSPLWFYITTKVNSKEAKLAWKKKNQLDFKKEHLKEWEYL